MSRAAGMVLTALVAAAIGLAVGRYWPSGGGNMNASSGPSQREVLYWVAPMDSAYRRDAPGKSPMGMDLVPVYAEQVDSEGAGLVTIDPRVVNNLGVRTALVERSPLSRKIDTVGYVQFDEETLYHMHTRVNGWVETLRVKASGEPVSAGQILLELYSPALVNAQEEFLATVDSTNKSLREASRRRLAALGVSEGEIDRLGRERQVRQRVQIAAQSDGFVANLGVRQGMYVTPADELMTVAGLDRVWIMAEVLERQADWISPGQNAEVTLDGLPGARLMGRVDYRYPELDPVTRTLKVRLKFDNEQQQLRPNMFARVAIVGTETGPVVHLPRQALIRGGRGDRVVVSMGDGRFRSRPVKAGIESGNRVQILEGVAEGERVVTSGQFLIDSESNIDSAFHRMDESDPGHQGMDHGQKDHGGIDRDAGGVDEEPQG